MKVQVLGNLGGGGLFAAGARDVAPKRQCNGLIEPGKGGEEGGVK